MKKSCKKCGEKHGTNQHHYCVVHSLDDSGFPTHSKNYPRAHRLANKAEKKAFGSKAFKEMEKIDAKLKKGELSGKNTKSGKLFVSSKVPKKFREEVAFHEMVENKSLRRKK